jgi:hypothetical protein
VQNMLPSWGFDRGHRCPGPRERASERRFGR